MASVSWHDLSGAELDQLLVGRVQAWIQMPFPAEVGTLVFASSTTGFDTSGLDAALGIPWELDKYDIGEVVAAATLEARADCHFPCMSFWDHRDPKVRPGGTDIVGFRGSDVACRFAFAEVKTSEELKSPPSVVSSGDHCLVRQLEHLRDVKRKRDTLVRYLQARVMAQSDARFHHAVHAYLRDHSDVYILGALLRPAPRREQDLKAAGTKLAPTSGSQAKVELHGIVLSGGFSALEGFAAALQASAS